MTISPMVERPILETHKPDAECWWCGGTRADSEHLFITHEAEPRCICDTCVEQNDWILTTPSGMQMWAFCNRIKLDWQEG